MAITGTPYTPGTEAVNWVAEVWDNEIEPALYFGSQLLPILTPRKKLMQTLHIPVHSGFTAGSVASTADRSGFGLTFSANVETEKTLTPVGIDLNVSVNDNTIWRMMTDPTSTFRMSVEAAADFKIDSDLFSLLAAATTNVEGSYATDTDKSGWLALKAKVRNAAKQFADNDTHAFYHPLQGDVVSQISEFIDASIRGAGSKPAVTGKVVDSYGLIWHEAGTINDSGGGFNNGIVVPRGIGVSFNKRPSVEMQRFGKAKWILMDAEYGYSTIRDQLLGLMKSLNT
jgi:hypothetical protein